MKGKCYKLCWKVLVVPWFFINTDMQQDSDKGWSSVSWTTPWRIVGNWEDNYKKNLHHQWSPCSSKRIYVLFKKMIRKLTLNPYKLTYMFLCRLETVIWVWLGFSVRCQFYFIKELEDCTTAEPEPEAWVEARFFCVDTGEDTLGGYRGSGTGWARPFGCAFSHLWFRHCACINSC